MPDGTTRTPPRDDFAGLVKIDRAHGSIFTSQAIFEAEMARIFHRTWVCVGHDGEIPNAGDFLTFSPDGRFLALTTRTNSVYLFDAPPLEVLDDTNR